MNILFWILQILLALHTAMGAVWKFSNSEQTVASLQAIPHAIWMSLSVVELHCTVGLLLPAWRKSLGKLVPIAAVVIAAEMLFFTGVHVTSGDTSNGQVVYWLVVAALCVFIAFGRLALSPIKKGKKAK